MAFIGAQSSSNSKIKKYSFTVTLSTQQNFTIAMGGGDELQVFLNGVLLQENVDFTASTSQVSLTANAVENDIVDIHIYQSFVLADAVPSSGGTFTGNVDFTGNITQNSASLATMGKSIAMSIVFG